MYNYDVVVALTIFVDADVVVVVAANADVDDACSNAVTSA